MPVKQDRNFDNLLHRLERTVYGTAKGSLRIELTQEDLSALRAHSEALTIWDAGCGFGQLSCWLAEAGHNLTLCDISGKMLERAKALFAETGVSADFHHRSAQELARELPQFDLVLLHAVVEWLADPLAGLSTIAERVKAGGSLSLLFYNRNAVIYKNVLKGDWRWRQLFDDSYLGKGKRLTPPNPLYPHDVLSALQKSGFTPQVQTGIRVFHDYLDDDTQDNINFNELFALEKRYCRLPTFRDMGRYVHILAKRDT